MGLLRIKPYWLVPYPGIQDPFPLSMLYNLVTGGGRCGWNLSWKLLPISEGGRDTILNQQTSGYFRFPKKMKERYFPSTWDITSHKYTNTTITETIVRSCCVQPSSRRSLIVSSERSRTWIPGLPLNLGVQRRLVNFWSCFPYSQLFFVQCLIDREFRDTVLLMSGWTSRKHSKTDC